MEEILLGVEQSVHDAMDMLIDVHRHGGYKFEQTKNYRIQLDI